MCGRCEHPQSPGKWTGCRDRAILPIPWNGKPHRTPLRRPPLPYRSWHSGYWPGRIGVAVRPEGSQFRIGVRDNGIGIRAEDFSRLFVEFQQLDSGVPRNIRGPGWDWR